MEMVPSGFVADHKRRCKCGAAYGQVHIYTSCLQAGNYLPILQEKLDPPPPVPLTDKFWEDVAAVGWGTKHTDSKKGAKILGDRLLSMKTDGGTKKKRDAFREEYSSARRVLSARINEWERQSRNSCGCSDDGFDDLVAHIIGLGKEEFEKVMADPKFAYDRAHAAYGSAAGYTESFSYCLHW